MKAPVLVRLAIVFCLIATSCTTYVNTAGTKVKRNIPHFAERRLTSFRVLIYQNVANDIAAFTNDYQNAFPGDLVPPFPNPDDSVWCGFRDGKCGGACLSAANESYCGARIKSPFSNCACTRDPMMPPEPR